MQAGKLDRMVTLQHRVLTRNAEGESVNVYEPYATVRAGKKDLRGREFYAAQQNNAELQATWTIRYRKDLSVNDRLVDDTGVEFDVVHVAEIGRREGARLGLQGYVLNEVTVSGLAELRETLLKSLPEALQGKALQLALTAAAKPIITVARAMAPEDTGNLRRAIYSFRPKNSVKSFERRHISVRLGRRSKRNAAFYWRFIEFGHGTITTKKRSLGNEKVGFFGHTVRAAPPRPFLRPAFETTKYLAIETFKTALHPAIIKVAGRAARKSYKRVLSSFARF